MRVSPYWQVIVGHPRLGVLFSCRCHARQLGAVLAIAAQLIEQEAEGADQGDPRISLDVRPG